MMRKKGDKDAIIDSIKKNTFKDYYRPQEFVENPKYTAMWQ